VLGLRRLLRHRRWSPKPRAVAVVVDGHRVLVMKRHKRGRPASYFLMTAVRGRPELSGPEAAANRPDNSFELCWATAEQFAGLGLHPPDIRGRLAELLADQG
jgi:hypothetical protein